MYEYEIARGNEINFIYGYSVVDAFRRRADFNPDEWTVLGKEYID